MRKHCATFLLLVCSLRCIAGEMHLHGFDFSSCTRWEFNTDIVAYDDPEYIAAAAKVPKGQTGESTWSVFEAINHKTYGKPLFGVCRYVFTSTNRPAKFECEDFGNFPLSGSTFSVIKDGGMYSSSYRCSRSCLKPIQLIHDQTSEDRRNAELNASWRKFDELCKKGQSKK